MGMGGGLLKECKARNTHPTKCPLHYPCNLDHHWFDSLGPWGEWGLPLKVEDQSSLEWKWRLANYCWIPQAPDTMGKRGGLATL